MAKAAFTQFRIEYHGRSESIGHTLGFTAWAQLSADLGQVSAMNGACVEINNVGGVIDDLFTEQRGNPPA